MRQTFSPGRLEAFSDGVIAVIITIMVLELKVPHADGMAGLRELVPILLVYLLSYTFIGIYWVNHHQLIGRLHRSNNRILWANLSWLFALSLVPFFTSYMVEKHLDAFSVMVYSGCMLVAGATFLLLRYGVDCQLAHEGRVTRLDAATQMKHWSSLGLYAAAVVMARFAPKLSLMFTGVVTLIWIVPTLGLFATEEGVVPSAEDGQTTAQQTR